jgi:hypothetical protein
MEENECRKFLKRLAEQGGVIVPTSALTPEEVAEARADGRLYVDDEGYGYVHELLN